jgi:Protein of unknown function (DUF2924)
MRDSVRKCGSISVSKQGTLTRSQPPGAAPLKTGLKNELRFCGPLRRKKGTREDWLFGANRAMCVVPGEEPAHMKNSIPKGDQKSLASALDALSVLDLQELDARWKSLYGSDPPDRIRRPLMIQALAYRLQEEALGGLKPATRRLLRNVAGDAERRRPIAVESKRPVKEGAVLIREWHGTKHQVIALKDGFMFRGKRFPSLSKIAGEITGTRWSGPLFFGLKNSLQEQQNGAH